MSVHPLDTILHKRDGLVLTAAEIEAFIASVVAQPDAEPISKAQIAAFLMAAFLRGLNREELAALTLAMRDSGEVFDPTSLPSNPRPFLIDKHSTGGVGDKTSLLVVPICAAAGLTIPMISGRSLGHTGGTLDKLESIPGYRTDLSLEEFSRVLSQCRASIIGQTARLAPADRILYALRDHTGTVESPALICASIMSKKLAEGIDALVLDVKTGSGAFMRTHADSLHLARLLVETGQAAGVRTIALLTAMNQPLGRYSGNSLEIQECVNILRAEPSQTPHHPMSQDLIELTLALAGHMLHLAGRAHSPEEGAVLATRLLDDGSAYRSFLHMVELHGGDLTAFTQTPNTQHQPTITRIFRASTSGFLASIDCRQVGWAIQRLGAGRTRQAGPVSLHAGLEVHAKLGTELQAGEPIFTLYGDSPAQLAEAEALLHQAIHLTPDPPAPAPLLRELIVAWPTIPSA